MPSTTPGRVRVRGKRAKFRGAYMRRPLRTPRPAMSRAHDSTSPPIPHATSAHEGGGEQCEDAYKDIHPSVPKRRVSGKLIRDRERTEGSRFGWTTIPSINPKTNTHRGKGFRIRRFAGAIKYFCQTRSRYHALAKIPMAEFEPRLFASKSHRRQRYAIHACS
eukprot:GEMP01045703.1.p1 GENE.GEMP01045703.1~~GEMP01045703.1.p1  ORF type:complete len:163 (-),score=28.95 GEMP01045703.1:969-1457(-)